MVVITFEKMLLKGTPEMSFKNGYQNEFMTKNMHGIVKSRKEKNLIK